MKLKKYLICLIVACLSITSIALADHTDLQWGMHPDEVYSILSKDYKLIQEEDSTTQRVELWANVKISKYKNDMYLNYKDGKLFTKFFEAGNIDIADRRVFNNLKASLIKKYGKPLYDTSTWNKKKMKSYSDTLTLMESVFLVCPIDELYNSPYYKKDLEYWIKKVEDGKYNMILWEPDEQTYISLVNWDKVDQFTDFYYRLSYVSKDRTYSIDTDGL